MEAFSTSPVTASHQTAKSQGTPQGPHGLSDIFAALLQEATIRLDARPADLASFEARRTRGEPPRRISAAETISSVDHNDRRDDASFRAHSVENDAEPARDPVEPIAPAENDTEITDDGESAVPAPEHDAEPNAVAATDETPEPDDHDIQLAEGEDAEAPASAPTVQDENEPAPEEIAAPVTLPTQAQPVAAATALGVAQALGAGEAAFTVLARAATQSQVPVQAAPQAQTASNIVPTTAGQFGAEVGATRVLVTPAAVVAQPNAALGGGAAVAALATEAHQAAAQNGAQNGTQNSQAGVSTAAGQMLAAATATASQNQAKPGNRTDPVTSGQAPAGGAANTAQSATIAHNGSGMTNAAPNAAPNAAQGAVIADVVASASGLQGQGQGQGATVQGTATGEPGGPNPQNARTAFAESNNQNAGNSSTPGGLSAETSASETGARNRPAQNARTDTARSLGAPVPGTDDAAGAEGSQQPGTSRAAAGTAQSARPVALENSQNNTAQTARADGSAQAGAAAQATAQNNLSGTAVAAAQATTQNNPSGTAAAAAQATAQNNPSGTAAAAERAMAPASVQRADGAGQANASNPTAAGIPGLTLAATRTPQTLPAQARPATAASLPANQVAVHIQRAVAAGQSQIRITLHPAELGQIDVKLNIGNDGAVKAIVSIERPETFELFQRDARGLEKALQDAGLKTDSGSLSFNLKGESEQDAAARREDTETDSQETGAETSTEPELEPEMIAAANHGGIVHALDMHV